VKQAVQRGNLATNSAFAVGRLNETHTNNSVPSSQKLSRLTREYNAV
jgi:hypothetical protein